MRLLVTVFVLMSSACGGMNVSADFDPAVDFGQFQTYDWGVQDALPTGDPRLDNNPFFDARVKAAVDSQLVVRGMRHSTVSPDLLVHYHASVEQRIDVYSVDRERGYVTDTRFATEVREYEEGTLIVDVVIAESNKLAWRGWAQSDVGAVIDRPPAMEARIKESVRRMFERFPRTL